MSIFVVNIKDHWKSNKGLTSNAFTNHSKPQRRGATLGQHQKAVRATSYPLNHPTEPPIITHRVQRELGFPTSVGILLAQITLIKESLLQKQLISFVH
jgi:hypothetical protein